MTISLHLRIILCIFVNQFVQFFVLSDKCQFLDRSFNALSDNSPWTIWNGTNDKLEISLCKPLASSACGQNVSICHSNVKDGIFVNLGTFKENGSIVTETVGHGLKMQFTGAKCVADGTGITTIFFKCGKTLGYPKYLPSENNCIVSLEWETTVACKNGTKLSQLEETKCYDYDSQHSLINLGVLQDQYDVGDGDDDDDDDVDDDGSKILIGGSIKISVCRNMNPDEVCPGYAACLISKKNKFSLGKISSSLSTGDSSSPSITYVDENSNLPECKTVKTTVNFICPERGIGSQPLIISSSKCNFVIEWKTEVACPEEETSVHSSCILSNDRNRLKVDFTSLKSNDPYLSQAVDPSGKKYSYYFHMCSDGLVDCGKFNSTVCQKSQDGKVTESIGNFTKQTLRFSDGKLQMVMEGGEPCGTGFQRRSVINFHCDPKTAKGSPTFAYEDMCTYIFDWNTALACISPSVPCTLKKGNITFDLSGLVKSEGEENWRTLGDHSVILNVCTGLVPSDPEAKNCTAGAICRKVEDKYINYGRTIQLLKYNKTRGALVLNYVDGDICNMTNNVTYSASLYLYCDPGVVNSQPRLVELVDKCHIDLEWYNSAACGIGHVTGQKCALKDPLTGLSFDLSPLRLSPPSNKTFYEVSDGSLDYNYTINICGPLEDDLCVQKHDVGVCQISKMNPREYISTGQWNEELHYKNGILKLTYKEGDKYHSDPEVPRHTDIEFLCDPNIRLGKPVFVAETNRTYKFLWRTSLACPNSITKCSNFISNGLVYDLSVLLQQGSRSNWLIKTTFNDVPVSLILNLCRSLLIGPELMSCDPLSSACLVGLDNDKTISLGRSVSQPVLFPGGLLLNYNLGSKCRENSSLLYSFELQLLCSDVEREQSGPSGLELSSPCKYTTSWSTSKACGIIPTNNNNNTYDCKIKLNNNDQELDLRSYTNKTFSVSVDGGNYEINVCGRVVDCDSVDAAVCKVAETGEKTNLVTTKGRKLTLDMDGEPQLLLNSDKVKFLITFECKQPPANEGLRFVKAQSNWLVLSLTTPAACIGQSIKCQTFDELGNKYNLEPLMKISGSWVAKNSNGDSCNINVCKSLSSNANPSCKSAGACLKKLSGEFIDAGHVKGNLKVTNNGLLQLYYEGGASCGNNKMRTTRMFFYCSNIAHNPVLLSDDVNTCEIIIQWSTPFACPYKTSIGSNCQVIHPSYPSQVFDLTLLKNVVKDFEVDFDTGRFLLSVCSEVKTNEYCKESKAGSCLITDEGPINMGMYTDSLEYDGGILSLTYKLPFNVTGHSYLKECKDGVSTKIDFKCEHDNLGISSGPTYLFGSCHRRFEWVTSMACFKYRKMPCMIRIGSNHEIDLSHLTLHDSNYEVEVNDDTKFIINVCSTLVHTKGNMCPPDSTACRIDKSGSKSIGELPSNPSDIGGETILSMSGEFVQLIYKGKEDCGGLKVSTIIQFMCDPQAPDTTTPKYLTSEGNCSYIFTWKTRLICKNYVTNSLPHCSVQDPETGHVFKLSKLIREEPYQVISPGQMLNVSVCSCNTFSGPSECGNDGQVPWSLTYEHGIIILKYPGGQRCTQPNKTSSTWIRFACPKENEGEGPQFVLANEDCLYLFNWPTRLVCLKEMKCLVQGTSYNLSPLINHNGRHTAVISDSYYGDVSEVYINVCTHVPSETGCTDGAAVCLKNSDGTFLNAGMALEEPKHEVSEGLITLKYTNGDECSGNKWTSKIIFQCNHTSSLRPTLEIYDKNNCLVVFRWETELVCPASSHGNATFEDCKFKLENQTYDFTPLSEKLSNFQNIKSDFGTFSINLCSNFQTPACKLSAVCLLDQFKVQKRGFGYKNGVIILREGKDIKFVYTGEDCIKNSIKYEGILIFSCDDRETLQVKTNYHGDCTVAFIIYSSLACPVEKRSALLKTNPSTPGQRIPSKTDEDTANHINYTPFVVVTVIIMCILFALAGFLFQRKRRIHRGYEAVDAMHYSRSPDEVGSGFFSSERKNDGAGLQNYASDDDLML